MKKVNAEIRLKLFENDIKYAELLPYTGFKHITRISEELAIPLTEEREKVYQNAIDLVLERRKK